jgi:hypothetical protein
MAVIVSSKRPKPKGYTRMMPSGFLQLPLVRSFAEESGSKMFRVEVRRDPDTGLTIRCRFPMPLRVGGPQTTRGPHTLERTTPPIDRLHALA